MKTCDNASVGVIIRNHSGDLLMFERVKPPVGIAPVAGHIDEHGTAEDAARAEVAEEVGLTVQTLTPVLSGWRGNRCRRRGGDGHRWTVFEAQVTGDVTTAADETRDARWYTPAEAQALAARTAAHARGELTVEEFAATPGLEPVWVEFLTDAGLIRTNSADLYFIERLAGGTR